MCAAVENAFFAPVWLFAFLVYFIADAVIARPGGTLASHAMAVLGWPINLAQKLRSVGPLPSLFLLPNLLVFGIFTFAHLFINVGFRLTECKSIDFSNRLFAVMVAWQRLLSENRIDAGPVKLEGDQFYRGVMDTCVFFGFKVRIMVLFSLMTALVLNRDAVVRGLCRSIFYFPVMLFPVVVGFLWTNS